MLLQLSIHHLALINDMTIDFEPGMNVMTGETGAGKSIVVDAVNLVLGERADRDLITNGEMKARVEDRFLLNCWIFMVSMSISFFWIVKTILDILMNMQRTRFNRCLNRINMLIRRGNRLLKNSHVCAKVLQSESSVLICFASSLKNFGMHI